jgi:hypothetical protein
MLHQTFLIFVMVQVLQMGQSKIVDFEYLPFRGLRVSLIEISAVSSRPGLDPFLS